MTLHITRATSPLGEIVIVARGTVLCALDFVELWPSVERRLERRGSDLKHARSGDPARIICQLAAYFDGEVDSLTSIETAAAGTSFQHTVWTELRKIPPGKTITYLEIAERLGRPSACRAVGSANGRNPIALVIPCHRVVGHDGSLRGYAGGLDRKRWLIAHEARHSKNTGNSAEC